MVRQFARFSDPVTPQLFARTHQKLTPFVVLAEQMPADFERTGRIELECLHVQLLLGGVFWITEAFGEFLIGHIPLRGPVMKPNPTLCLCSSGSTIIWMASSRCIGGITNRSSNVQSEVSR